MRKHADALSFRGDGAADQLWQLLVFEPVRRFAIQAVGITIDDFDVATVTFLAFEASQVGAGRALKQSGAVLVYAIQPDGQFPKEV